MTEKNMKAILLCSTYLKQASSLLKLVHLPTSTAELRRRRSGGLLPGGTRLRQRRVHRTARANGDTAIGARRALRRRVPVRRALDRLQVGLTGALRLRLVPRRPQVIAPEARRRGLRHLRPAAVRPRGDTTVTVCVVRGVLCA